MSPLRNDNKQEMPLRLQDSKVHKDSNIFTIILVKPLCFSVFPESRDKVWQKKAFWKGLIDNILVKTHI